MGQTSRACGVAVLSLLAVGTTACTKILAFGTATKFALDISQRADQSIDVSLGYDRAEIASIPAPSKPATKCADTYSVLGTFSVSYDNPWSGKPLVLKQLFATGMAARDAAADDEFRKAFGRDAKRIESEARKRLESRDQESRTKETGNTGREERP